MAEPPAPPPDATAFQDPPGTVGALVWGIIGVTVLPLVGSIVAIVMGGNARDRATAQGLPEPSLARAGRIIGWVGLLVVLIPLVLAIIAAIVAFALTATS